MAKFGDDVDVKLYPQVDKNMHDVSGRAADRMYAEKKRQKQVRGSADRI